MLTLWFKAEPDNYEGRDDLISQEGKFSCLLVRWSEIDSPIFYHASLLKMQLAGGEGKDPKIQQLVC